MVRDHTPSGYWQYLHCSRCHKAVRGGSPSWDQSSGHTEDDHRSRSNVQTRLNAPSTAEGMSGVCCLWMLICVIQTSLRAHSKFNTLWNSGMITMKMPCKVVVSLYLYARDHCGRVSNTYQKKSGDANCKPLCLQMPDKGLWGVEQEHDRLVVNVDWGDGIQVQSDLESTRKRNLRNGFPLKSFSISSVILFQSSALTEASYKLL